MKPYGMMSKTDRKIVDDLVIGCKDDAKHHQISWPALRDKYDATDEWLKPLADHLRELGCSSLASKLEQSARQTAMA